MQLEKLKKHLMKNTYDKPIQMLTQKIYFSTSVWFPQTATHLYAREESVTRVY